ncbi:hypothetical protein CEXT_581641 [Caerostris extrusa]|uniref:Uncharacterized protein n=1 Tax=Caerostris extrusa TaxID=172846 RepID=A0AAV4XHN7_CAEEX|nr:hypothetical protein CEXT_581641 [Caerostris extrusa]
MEIPWRKCASNAHEFRQGTQNPSIMDARRVQALLRVEISSRISIPRPKEAVEAKAKASPLQFASEIHTDIGKSQSHYERRI